MQRSLSQVQCDLAARVLAMRSIQRILTLVEFEEAYETATDEQRTQVNNCIDSVDRIGVERWLRNQRDTELASQSVTVLRRRAQSLGVPYYNRLSKAVLLSEITKYENQGSTGRPGSAGRSTDGVALSYATHCD